MRFAFFSRSRRAAASIMSLALLSGALVSMPALATAASAPSSSTMVLSFREFPSGNPVPNTLSAKIPVTPGASITLTAPTQILGTPPTAFGFAFWNASVTASQSPNITFSAPSVATFNATAWYFPEGGSGGPGKPGVSTVAFSMDQDSILSVTPIAAVTPNGAWAGSPSTIVSTTTSTSPVVITARQLIVGDGMFNTWINFGSGTPSGKTLTVPANGASLAIAFYGIPQGAPTLAQCQQDESDLASITPDGFPSQQEYLKVLHFLEKQVQICRQDGVIQ